MNMPEEYMKYFTYEIGESVMIYGVADDIFEIVSYGVELDYSPNGSGKTFFYIIISEANGDIEKAMDGEIISLSEFEELSEEEANDMFSGGAFFASNVEIVCSEEQENTLSVDELLDRYNALKSLYEKVSHPSIREMVAEVELQLLERSSA